jgi:signal transduction histidine kinase
VEHQLSFEAELIDRIDWLIRLRWLAVAGVVLAVGLLALWFPTTLALGPLLGTTAIIGIYNLLFLCYLRTLRSGSQSVARLRRATSFAYVQIALDLVALAALIHFAGGVENLLAFFLVFHVIIASILLPRGSSYLVAALAVLLYESVIALEYTGLLPHYHLPMLRQELYQNLLYLFTASAVMMFMLFLVAYLATSIASRLRERDRELWESNQTCQIRSQELQDLNEQLRRIDGERTRFMVLVTHELRAPISTIYSALELALGGYAPPEKTREVLARAQNRATDLLDLIRDLLDLTKVREETDEQAQVVPIQMADVLREVVDFVRVEAEGKGLTLEVEIKPDLAPVRALPEQMKLVWTNLLSNAIKYSKSGGKIQVSLDQDARRVIGSVRDTGIGIPAEDLPRIFDEFYRAGNARDVTPHGTGIGLAVVRRIVDNWEGDIWAESKVGQGSTFTFVLPRADAGERA